MKQQVGKHLNRRRYWNEGAQAARDGKPLDSCSYTRNWKSRAWHNGYFRVSSFCGIPFMQSREKYLAYIKRHPLVPSPDFIDPIKVADEYRLLKMA